MNRSRRNFIQGAAVAGAAALSSSAAAQHQHHEHAAPQKSPGAAGAEPFLSIETPDIEKMPWEWDGGVKVFRIRCEVVKREFLPGWTMDVWGFNGSMPGPTIEVQEGDRVRLIVENHLPETTSLHWHGLEVPIEMDGVMGLTQDGIDPGGSFTYEFTLHQNGTFFYHSHMPMQQMMGMIGFFIVHPKTPHLPAVQRDFGLIVQEWAVLPNNTIPNSLSMEFNWLTINGKVGPATTPLLVRQGERARIRFVNLGMDHHPMHLHGNTFWVTGTEGMRIPQTAWIPGNTVLVGVAQSRDVEFDAHYQGDWMLHCHLPHHNMNHMASMVGPLAHLGRGPRAGMGMEEGMGMVRRGTALSDENGPSFGRAMGVGATNEETVSHLVGQQHQHQQHKAAPNALLVPGYPQDHHMVLDEEVAKPETFGLRAGWSGAVMGMMTLVRVLPEAQFVRITAMRRNPSRVKPAKPTEHKHPAE